MNNNGRVSVLDVLKWLKKLKENNITEFEHGKLPKNLQKRKFLMRAKNEGLIRSIRVENGRNIWQITDNV